MNAADDKEKCEEPSSSSSGLYNERVEHNDCSRHASSTVCNGARPKTQPLSCNIPNGIPQTNYTLKLNNNVSILEGEKMRNGNGMDVYMRNNVDYCVPIDKCPPKVRKEPSDNSRMYNREEESLSENEEEEYCIYTYKGDQNQMADLPSSFFRLGVVPPGRENNESRSSSPDMDYLEMDFDPGPSNGRGDSSDDSDCCDMQHDDDDERNCEVEEMMQRRSVSPMEAIETAEEDDVVEFEIEVVCHQTNSLKEVKNDLSGSAKPNDNPSPPPPPQLPPPQLLEGVASSSSSCSSSQVVLPVPTASTSRDSWGYHCSSGDLCSPGDPSENTLESWGESAADYLKMQGETNNIDARNYNLRSALYHCIMAKRLVLDKEASFTDGDQSNLNEKQADSPDSNRPVERTMIWTEQEACTKQITQIGTSQCGVTAVINVLVALNIPFSLEKLKEGVGTRFRSENAPVPEYLFSRSLAGATHYDLICGVDVASQGSLYARFFHMYPERNISLTRWLSGWLKKGAIPIATVNLQRGVGPDGAIPDVWHHQMVFGVGPRGVYLTNPLECISESSLMVQLCSPPVLKIRRADILSRWTSTTDLSPLIKHSDVRWKRMNVLGQVVNVIREAQWSRQGLCSRTLTSHVSIPASYSSGITLVIPRKNPACDQLMNTPELPLAPT